MPITELDSRPALVVIDLQKGVVGFPTAHPVSGVIERTVKLAKAFREKGLPVVLVNVTGRAPGRTDAGPPKFAFPADWAELIPELERQPGDLAITKQRVGAFLGTSLDDDLRKLGVTQIILTGVATGSGVESTGRSAYDLGYNVVFATDAMTDLNEQAHRNSVEITFPKLGETGTADDVLRFLNKR